jgi:hypothetical protein
MSLRALLAALAAVGLGEFLKRWIIRKWAHFRLQPKAVVFPPICPVCLSPDVDDVVEEESSKRQTANYIVAQKLEWWKLGIPHCKKCTSILLRNKLVGVVIGGVCALGAFVAIPPAEVSTSALCYFLFGYPAYAISTTVQKGIVFGRASSDTIHVHVRRSQYSWLFVSLNHLSKPD